MSPASRGIVPGLFLALAAALAVLAANNHWLFPALDATGVRYLAAAPVLAEGGDPMTPWMAWDASEPEPALSRTGTLMPLAMGALVERGARPHVAGLWIVGGAVACAVAAAAWVAGGAGGMAAAVLGGVALAAAPLTRDVATTLGPDAVLAALTLLLLGVMAYRPRWTMLHGAVAAGAWLAHPAGVGLVAAALLWPVAWGGFRAGAGATAARISGAGVAPLLLLAAGTVHPLLAPGHLGTGVQGGRVPGTLSGTGTAVAGVLRWAGWDLPGVAGPGVGAVLLLLLGATVFVDARRTPEPPADTPWSDPRAPDVVALALRPAAGLLVLATLLGAAAASAGALGHAGGGDPATASLARPWFSTAAVLSALAAAVALRGLRRGTRWGRVATALLVAWTVVGGARSVVGLGSLRDSGRGVTAAVWVESPVIRWLDNQGRGLGTVYTNAPALLLLQSGIRSRTLPDRVENVDAFARAFGEAPGIVVITGLPEPVEEALRGTLGLSVLVDAPEGRVLAPDGSAAP